MRVHDRSVEGQGLAYESWPESGPQAARFPTAVLPL